MIKFFTGKWSIFLSGGAIAFIFVLSLYLLNTPVGMSDGYLMISEYCKETVHTVHNRSVSEPPVLDWQTGFLGGIFLGALLAALIGGNFKFRLFPEERKYKDWLKSTGITPVQGIAGGFLVMLGLQLAGDSFLGQWAAAIQFSTGAWLFLICSLITAVITGLIMSFSSGAGEGSDKGGKK